MSFRSKAAPSAFHRNLAATVLLARCFALDATKLVGIAIAALAISITITVGAQAQQEPILIGLDADFSGNAPQSGLAIERGMLLAIDEVNSRGGVLGRPLALQTTDNRGVPARGVDNLDLLLAYENLAALVGGLHSPVMLAQLETAHAHSLPFFSAWAAATQVVDNGLAPNNVFRLSVRDEYAGKFLIDTARARGFRKPGLLLWRSGWGLSNEAAMTAAIDSLGLDLAGIEWFNITETDLSGQVERLIADGADVIMLVANPDEGIAAVRAMAARDADKRVPLISHWGITGTDFQSLDPQAIMAVDLTFLQTYSFFDAPFPEKSDAVFAAYCARFGECKSPADVVSPAGTAHGYDIVHLIARAIEKAGNTDRPAIVDALQNLDRYEGLVRVYDPPFSRTDHEALGIEDYSLARFDAAGAIIPASSGQ